MIDEDAAAAGLAERCCFCCLAISLSGWRTAMMVAIVLFWREEERDGEG